ncbi:hypothetical protein DQ04_00501130 [Trypanosoma grayi]|uniref:hypothetical protein n=1 Tax=Trypanosoma grayi TaxID=71804 RepID=UPI0004F3F8B5|nr:hypothetical protein DQ04_00501130 [Trypanosoma grayi]KEG14373.1 hypothetical protein DQ04_00501130 [Trypanosoma grayi]
MKIQPVAAGILPVDLIDAIRGGAVTLSQKGDSTILFHDAAAGVEWSFDLTPAEEECTFRHQLSGAGGSAQIPRFAAVKKMLLEHEDEVPCTLTAERPDTPPLRPSVTAAPVTLADVLQQHHALAVKVAHTLAPAPRDHREFLSAVAPVDSDALDAVLQVLTRLNRRGQRELEAAGYELVDIERYGSKAVKQQVANLALPKVAHDKAVLDRFALYADRDVMLAVCSKGIMHGLGTAKRQRHNDTDDDDDDDDDNNADEGEEGVARRKAVAATQATKTEKASPVLLTSMEQSGIRWGDGDLTREPWVMPSAVKEALVQRQQAEAAARSRVNHPLASMPIVDATQLTAARGHYVILQKEYQIVYDLLRRLEDVSVAARGWCETNNGRLSQKLRKELECWFEKQEGPRATLTTSLDILHKALYQLKREIEDYVNLREWGVVPS